MGLSVSTEKEVEENPSFNFEEYNKKIASSGIYTNNPMTTFNEQEYYLKDNGFVPKPFKVEESTVSKVTLNFSLVRNSLSISKEDNKLTVSLKYTAKKPGLLKLCFMVDEAQDEVSGVPSLTAREELVQQVKPTASNGFSINRQIIPSAPVSTLNLQRKHNSKWFPFVITIGDEEQKLYTYVRTVNNFHDTVIIKQKLQNDGLAFYMQEVFGLSKSSEERLCIICYTDQSEVIIFPCGHLCLCFSCCGELMRTSENCPICRKPITAYERIKSSGQKVEST